MIFQARDRSDIELIVNVCQDFRDHSEFVNVDYEYTVNTYDNLLQSGTGAMFALTNDSEIIGGLACICFPDIHSGILMAVETFWVVHPDHRGGGKELFDAFEKWGAEKGAKKLAMIHLADSMPNALERFYARQGYKLQEKHFEKEI